MACRRWWDLSQGNPDGQHRFKNPCGLAISKTSNPHLLFVSDKDNNRVQVFNISNFRFVRSIACGQNPRGICLFTNAAGREELFVAEQIENRVQVFHASTGASLRTIGSGQGSGAGQLRNPFDVAVHRDSSGVVRAFVVDARNNRVQVFNADTGAHMAIIGSYGSGNGQLYCPAAVKIREVREGDRVRVLLFVGEYDNHRMSVFDAMSFEFVRVMGNGKGRRNGQFNFINGMGF